MALASSTDFYAMHPEVDPETRARIEALRPPRPFWINASSVEASARWAVSWRVAAAYALCTGAHSDERERRMFVWSAARHLHASDLATL